MDDVLCWITTILVCMLRVGWNPSWFPDYRDYGSLSTGIWSLRWLFLYLRSYDLVGSVTKPNHVYKLKKALYGLKQAPRAWYERLRDFLLSKGFIMGNVDTTIFTKKIEKDLFVLQIYVDDIIFGSTNQDFYEEFRKTMANEFEMSMIEELSYFLGL